MSARLHFNPIPLFSWKKKTFHQVTANIFFNNPVSKIGDMNKRSFFSPLPLKIWRKQIRNNSQPFSYSRYSTTLRSFETPGGSILHDTTKDTFCKGDSSTLDINYNQHLKPCTACDTSFTHINSTSLKNLSTQENARRRVRSSGLNRVKYLSDRNNTANYYTTDAAYLYGRNKMFSQNQFHNLRNSTNSSNNAYASNTIQSCGVDDYVPVVYKPNNSKFATQGSVSASTRLVQLKYDTITDAGSTYTNSFGKATANALAYGVPANGYTVKDKIGYPNKCTPVFLNGKMINKTCTGRRNLMNG